jgi:hemerythrin
MAFEWSPDLEIGIAGIDAQHRELFACMNTLVGTLHRGSREGVAPALEFLASYVSRHFVAEEHAMQALGYPVLAAHRQEHRAFEAELAARKAAYDAKGAMPSVALDLVIWLGDWLLQHVRRTDRELGAWAAAGVAGGAPGVAAGRVARERT